MRKFSVWRLVLLGVLVLFAFAGGRAWIPGLILELLLLGALLFALSGFDAIRDLLEASPKPARLVAFWAVGLLVTGQVLVKSATFAFPLVGWTMYGTVQTDDPVFYEYTAVRSSGETEGVLPARLIPSLANSRIDNRLKRLISAIDASETEVERAEKLSALETWLNALGALLNRADDGDPFVEIHVARGTVPMHGYTGPESVIKEPLYRVRLVASP